MFAKKTKTLQKKKKKKGGEGQKSMDQPQVVGETQIERAPPSRGGEHRGGGGGYNIAPGLHSEKQKEERKVK